MPSLGLRVRAILDLQPTVPVVLVDAELPLRHDPLKVTGANFREKVFSVLQAVLCLHTFRKTKMIVERILARELRRGSAKERAFLQRVCKKAPRAKFDPGLILDSIPLDARRLSL